MEEYILAYDCNEDLYLLPLNLKEEFEQHDFLVFQSSVNEIVSHDDSLFLSYTKDFDERYCQYKVKNISKLIIKDFKFIA